VSPGGLCGGQDALHLARQTDVRDLELSTCGRTTAAVQKPSSASCDDEDLLAATGVVTVMMDRWFVQSAAKDFSNIQHIGITFAFTLWPFGGRFYPKRLKKSTFVEGETAIYHIKIRIEQVSSIHSCKANRTSFIIARLPA